MPTFTLNGTPVELVPQERGAFDWLAGQVYRRMHEGVPIPGMLTMIADAGVKAQNLPTTDPRIQAALWTLWQMGIASSRVEGEGDARQVKWEKGEHPDLDSRPAVEHFNEEGIREGRALAAGLVIVHGRRIRVNGVEMPVKVNNIDLIRAQSAELEKRRTDPKQDPSLPAAAYVAELLSQGSDQNDLRLRAALELAADLGIRSLVIDGAARQMRIEGFNEQAALAAAYFQGAPAEHFQAAINRASTLNRMAQELAKQAGAATPNAAARPQGKAPAQAPGTAAAGPAAAAPFKRRRR